MLAMDLYQLRSTKPDGWQNESGDLRGQGKQLHVAIQSPIGEEQVSMQKLVLLHAREITVVNVEASTVSLNVICG